MTGNMDKWASRHRKIEKSGHWVAAKIIPLPRRWHGGTISANLEAIWGMSDKTAVKWYRLAAEQGVADAQGNLGVMYYLETGIPVGYVYSYMWENFSSSNENENGEFV